MSSLSCLTGDREDLILRLADVAEHIRNAAGAPPAPVCPYICDVTHRIAWGSGLYCTNCGLPVLDATFWHRLLIDLLRLSMAPRTSEVAA